jgi:hypothetical protein
LKYLRKANKRDKASVSQAIKYKTKGDDTKKGPKKAEKKINGTVSEVYSTVFAKKNAN